LGNKDLNANSPNKFGFWIERTKENDKISPKGVKIIILVGSKVNQALKEDQEKCLAAGMNDFLTKPIEISKLKSTIIKYIPTIRS